MAVQDSADGERLCLDLRPLRSVGVEHTRQHATESRPAIPIIRREVGAAIEHLSLGREKRRQRPAPLMGQHLDRTLIARVYVRTLVAVYLDADEVLVQVLRKRRVFIRFSVHDVAPVAPDRPDVEQHRPVSGARGGKRLGAPRVPMDRLVGGGLKIGGGG